MRACTSMAICCCLTRSVSARSWKLARAPEVADETSAAEADPAEIAGALERLREYLGDYDGETADFLVEARGPLLGALGAGGLAEVDRHVQQFDFEEALAALERHTAERARGAA